MHDVLLPPVHRLGVHVVEAVTAKTVLELRSAVEVENENPLVAHERPRDRVEDENAIIRCASEAHHDML